MSIPLGRLPSTPELPIVHGSGNVFLDLGFGPEEAESLQLRSLNRPGFSRDRIT